MGSELSSQVSHEDSALERLHDVVISAEAQTSDDVRIFCACCCEDNRRISLFTHFAAKIESIIYRKHDVKDDSIDFHFIHDLEGFLAIVCDIWFKAGAFQEISFHVGNLRFIFHYTSFSHQFVLLPSFSGISNIIFNPFSLTAR